MTFGLTKSEIASVDRPEVRHFEWGTLRRCALLKGHYAMERFDLQGVLPLHFYLQRRGTYYLERGEVTVRSLLASGQAVGGRMRPGALFAFEPGELHALHAKEFSILYLFSNDGSFEEARFAEEREPHCQAAELLTAATFDHREKYWGRIESTVAQEFAGKRITMCKGGQSSLEFHCHKAESYCVHSGLLKVGLRFGRAENGSVVLESGQSFTILPGLMHMRIALEETVLFEISTRDNDKDSHLVEDGRSYVHKE